MHLSLSPSLSFSLSDFHEGPCTTDEPTSKRPRYCPPPPKPRKSASEREEERNARRRARASHDADAEPFDGADPPPINHKPALQFALPSGLRRFYHVHRWGVPLADGPIEALTGNASDDDVDEDWRLDEQRRRSRSRPELSDSETEFMSLWNVHVQSLPPLVSDRMLPEACRRFALKHAALLREKPGETAPLRTAFREHLSVMWQHNLLHQDDVRDCLLLAESYTSSASASASAASSASEQISARELFAQASSSAELVCCPKCLRPVHESHCALAGRARGAAAWPTQSGLDLAEDPDAILEGGPMSAQESALEALMAKDAVA